MVVTVIEEFSNAMALVSYAERVYEFERIRDDPVKCKAFLEKYKSIDEWPILGHTRHAPHMILGHCYNCANEVRKFSGWSLKTRVFPYGSENNYYAESFLHCRHCTPHTLGWEQDRLTVQQVMREVFGV